MDRVLAAAAEQAGRYAGGPARAVLAGRDDLKRLYEALIPAQLRHALGEYYTPDWLAEYTLRRGLALDGRDIRTLRAPGQSSRPRSSPSIAAAENLTRRL